MFSLTFLTRPLPGISLEQFVEHYRGPHFLLGRRLPGLVSYQQSMLLKDQANWQLPGMLRDWEALSVYTFDSAGAAESAFASDAGVELNADTVLFMEWASILSLPSEVIERWDARPSSPDRSLVG